MYVEIGTLIPKSASAYYVLREVYGDLVGFLYMFTWVIFLLPGGMILGLYARCNLRANVGVINLMKKNVKIYQFK